MTTTPQISRRTVAQGVAWSVPTMMVASSVPAFAASCVAPTMTAFPDPGVFGTNQVSSVDSWTNKRPIAGGLNLNSGANDVITKNVPVGDLTGAQRLYSSEMDSSGNPSPIAISTLNSYAKDPATGKQFLFSPNCTYTFTFYTYASYGDLTQSTSVAQAMNFYLKESATKKIFLPYRGSTQPGFVPEADTTISTGSAAGGYSIDTTRTAAYVTMPTQSIQIGNTTIGMEKHSFTYKPTVQTLVPEIGFVFFVQQPVALDRKKSCDDILVSVPVISIV